MTSREMLMFAIYCEREASRAADMSEAPVISPIGNWWHHADDRGEFQQQCKYFFDLARRYRAELTARAQRGDQDA